MQMCRASGAALCDAPASCSQPQELPGGCDGAELYALHPFPGWSRLARQLLTVPRKEILGAESPLSAAVSICLRSH